ncbi:hypothetical protein RhiJN_10813 [Ceratobasidium sp. AG-Ba]|nr:hypothetical protein RhiJN_10813 [Ceratobasidium sp. AG-Ba]
MSFKTVWLSNLNFAECQEKSPDANSVPFGKKAEPSQANAPRQSNSYVRMSGDTLGEELAPDATIWKLYVEEAAEQDNELANAQNKNLDLMLLFATLFSAILTAFLLDAKKLLEEDPASTSAALLLLLTQSQQRLELGVPDPSLKLASRTEFTPSKTARFVNGLWFTALALSLAGALIAMLAKEWLAAFVSSSVRPPYGRALQRQAKYTGLVSWRALYIIACLPSLLHLALLLFAIGLVLYLWNLDEKIAIIISIITGTTCILYLLTTMLGALFESCPFVTSISMYIRTSYTTLFGDHNLFRNRLRSEQIIYHDGVHNETLEAVGWLAAHSRDPAVSQCAYQAMAGFIGLSSVPICKAPDPYLVSPNYTSRPSKDGQIGPQIPNDLEVDTNLKFMSAICQQFTDAVTHKPREVTACLGSNLARYAAALPPLAAHLETLRQSQPVTGLMSGQDRWKFHRNTFELAFTTIDRVWDNNCVPLSADTYAVLTASELRLTAIVISLDTIDPFNTSAAPNHFLSAEQYRPHISLQPLNYHVLETHVSPTRYNCALARASVLLRYHHAGQAIMSNTALIHLIDSISDVVISDRVVFGSDSEINVNVVGGVTEHCPNPNVLYHPNGVFSQLLKTWDLAAMPGTWSKLEHAAARAVSSFAHHFFKQRIGQNEIRGPQSRSRSSSYRGIDFELPISPRVEADNLMFQRALESWPTNQDSSEYGRTLSELLSRLLLISAIAILEIDPAGHELGISILILRSACRVGEALSGQKQLYDFVVKHRSLIERLIELVENKFNPTVCQDDTRSHSSASRYLIRFLSFSFDRRTLIPYCGLQPQSLVSLLKIISRTSDLAIETEIILSDIMQLLQDKPTGFASAFLQVDGALITLLEIGGHVEDQRERVTVVTDASQRIIHYLLEIMFQETVVVSLSLTCGTLAAFDFLWSMSPGEENARRFDALKGRMSDYLEQNINSETWSEVNHFLNSARDTPTKLQLSVIHGLDVLGLCYLLDEPVLQEAGESNIPDVVEGSRKLPRPAHRRTT